MSPSDIEKGIPAQAHGADTQEKTYDNPQTKLWSMYLTEVEKHDQALVESWKGDMDGILIFAGLFSASVTAFIIEVYHNLNSNAANTTVALLAQISKQLAATSEGAQIILPSPSLENAPFTPTSSALRVNALWFLSLIFSIACALMATLVQQWSRHYLQAGNRHSAPHRRARIRAYVSEGLTVFGMSTMVEGIPTLLHISVFLFFVGLVDFLFSVNQPIAYMALAVVALCGMLYFLVTFLPIIYPNCPYRTPFSTVCWRIMQGMRLLRFPNANGVSSVRSGIIQQGQEDIALLESRGRVQRDANALQWTLESLNEDGDLEQFVAGVPAFLGSPEDASNRDGYGGIATFVALLSKKDARLSPRIAQLLRTAQRYFYTGNLQRRGVLCLQAVYSFLQARQPLLLSQAIQISMLSSDKYEFHDCFTFRAAVNFLLRNRISEEFLSTYREDVLHGQATSGARYTAYWEEYLQWNTYLASACGIEILGAHRHEKPKLAQQALMKIRDIEAVMDKYYQLELIILLRSLGTSPIPIEAITPVLEALRIFVPYPRRLDRDTQLELVRLAFEPIIGRETSRKLGVLPEQVTHALIAVAFSLPHPDTIQHAERMKHIYVDLACPDTTTREIFSSMIIHNFRPLTEWVMPTKGEELADSDSIRTCDIGAETATRG